MHTFLVTGSRVSTEEIIKAVNRALTLAEPEYLILGCCPTGADAAAVRWAAEHGVPYHVHKADWGRWGNCAGPLRNGQMVEDGRRRQAVVLAFPRGRAAGTKDCISQALAAGLEVIEL